MNNKLHRPLPVRAFLKPVALDRPLASLAVTLIAFVLLATPLGTVAPGWDFLYPLICAIGCIGVAHLTTRHATIRGLPSVLNVRVLSIVFFAGRYGVGAFLAYWWSVIPWTDPQTGRFFQTRGISASIADVSAILLLGICGMFLGTALTQVVVNEADYSRNSRLPTASVLAVLAGTFAYLNALTLLYAPLAVRNVLLSVFSVDSVLLILLSTVWFSSTRRAARAPLMLGLATTLSATLLLWHATGMRFYIIRYLLYVTAGYLISRKRLPPLRAVVPVCICVVLISPLLFAFKESMQVGAVRGSAESLAEVSHRVSLGGASVEQVLSNYLLRVNGAEFITTYRRYYPDVYPFEHGRTFALTLVNLVPRWIWPEKPQIPTLLNEYSRRVGIVGQGDTVTSAVFDAVSEYYLNGGSLFVFCCCLLHGAYMSLLCRVVLHAFGVTVGSAALLALLIQNHDYFGFVQMFVTHAAAVPMWLLVTLCIFRSSRKHDERA